MTDWNQEKQNPSLNCLRVFDDPLFELPTAVQIKSLRNFAGWTQEECARRVGVAFVVGNGSSAIKKWESDESKPAHRKITYAAWRLMLLYAGIIDPDFSR